MFEAQVNEYKYEISRLMREMSDIKKRYFEQKRKEQLEKDQSKREPGHTQYSSSQPRFTGGGFSLATHG